MSNITRHQSLQGIGHSMTLFILENDTDWNDLVSKLPQDFVSTASGSMSLGGLICHLCFLCTSKAEIGVNSEEELHGILAFPNYLEGSATHELFYDMSLYYCC